MSSAGTDNAIPHELRFRATLVQLIELCRDIIVDTQRKGAASISVGLIDVANAALSKLDPVVSIKGFIEKSHIYWPQIKTRHEDFFHANMAKIFADVPLIDMKTISGLFHAKVSGTNEALIPEDDREAVWDFLHVMVKICIKFIHEGRQPIAVDIEGKGMSPFYRTSIFPDVTLEKHAKEWGIQLKFY